MLKGKLVKLRPLSSGDISLVTSWCFENELALYYIGTPLFTAEEIRQYLDAQLTNSSKNRFFMIINRKDEKPIGFNSLENINLLHRSASYAVFLGVHGERKKEYVWDAHVRCMDYAFDVLNLNRIEMRMYHINIPIIKLLAEFIECTRNQNGEALYTHEGTLREAAFLLGKYTDVEVFSLLRADYKKHQRRVHRIIREIAI